MEKYNNLSSKMVSETVIREVNSTSQASRDNFIKNLKTKSKIISLFFALFVVTHIATAQIIRYVMPNGTGDGSSWENAAGDIQSMINASNSGCQVWVRYGNYSLSETLLMKQGVNVYGGFFGNETSIDDRPKSDLDGNGTIEAWEFTHTTVLNGQYARQVLRQSNNFMVETVWDGVTITNGRNEASGSGASIMLNGKLVNSIVSGNTSFIEYSNRGNGGGIVNFGGTISHCLVSSNTVSTYHPNVNTESRGGGIYNWFTVSGGVSYRGIVEYCTVINNTATSLKAYSSMYCEGGGIYNGGIVRHCIVSGNTTFPNVSYGIGNISSGGGIYNIGIVENCTVDGNTAKAANFTNMLTRGGGIYGGIVSRCVITGNISYDSGGALYNCEADNCLIAENSGGGAYNGTYSNCTFVYNYGGIVSQNSSNYAILTNCIVWNNSGVQVGTNTIVTYSGVQGGFTGTGNINLPTTNDAGGPLFLNPDDFNFRLLSTSPCVNSGDNFAVTNPYEAKDLDGNPRIYGDTVDMGCYEFGIYHTVSGRAIYNGSPLVGVDIIPTIGIPVSTNEVGEYTVIVPENSTITITPILQGYEFSPEFIVCENVSNDIPNQNFEASAVGIKGSLADNKAVVVYPNPAKDKIFVEFEDFVQVEIKLYDMFGNEVLNQNGNSKTEINISHLSKGVYNVVVVSVGKVIGNRKIVKQ